MARFVSKEEAFAPSRTNIVELLEQRDAAKAKRDMKEFNRLEDLILQQLPMFARKGVKV